MWYPYCAMMLSGGKQFISLPVHFNPLKSLCRTNERWSLREINQKKVKRKRVLDGLEDARLIIKLFIPDSATKGCTLPFFFFFGFLHGHFGNSRHSNSLGWFIVANPRKCNFAKVNVKRVIYQSNNACDEGGIRRRNLHNVCAFIYIFRESLQDIFTLWEMFAKIKNNGGNALTGKKGILWLNYSPIYHVAKFYSGSRDSAYEKMNEWRCDVERGKKERCFAFSSSLW